MQHSINANEKEKEKYGVVGEITYGRTATLPNKTIDLDGQKITVVFPIVFEGKSESGTGAVQSRFTIMEPDANGKVEVYFERMTETLLYRFKDVLEQLMDKFGVKDVRITTQNKIREQTK